MTEARELAKKADKYIAAKIDGIDSLNFHDRLTVPTIDGLSEQTLKGDGTKGLELIGDSAAQIGQMARLEALLSLARQTQTDAKKEVMDMTLDKYCEQQGIVVDKIVSRDEFLAQKGMDDKLKAPTEPLVADKKDVLDKLNQKDRCTMLQLNSQCAAIGDAIHPNGSFAQSRDKVLNSAGSESALQSIGNMAVVVAETPSVNPEDVNRVFFGLQDKHRQLEAQLNKINENIKRMVREENMDRQDKHRTALAQHESQLRQKSMACNEYAAMVDSHGKHMQQLAAELNQWKEEQVKMLDSLRVAIPDDLKDTLQILTDFKTSMA